MHPSLCLCNVIVILLLAEVWSDLFRMARQNLPSRARIVAALTSAAEKVGMRNRRSSRSSSRASITSGRCPRSLCKCPSAFGPPAGGNDWRHMMLFAMQCLLRRLRQYVHVDGGSKRGAASYNVNSKRKPGTARQKGAPAIRWVNMGPRICAEGQAATSPTAPEANVRRCY